MAILLFLVSPGFARFHYAEIFQLLEHTKGQAGIYQLFCLVILLKGACEPRQEVVKS